MFEDIKDLARLRKKYNQQMFRSDINTFRELEELEANTFRDGALTQKYKELIGLAVGINNACYG